MTRPVKSTRVGVSRARAASPPAPRAAHDGQLGGAAPDLRRGLDLGAVARGGRQQVRDVLARGEADALAEQTLALGLLLADGVAAQRAQELGGALGVGARRQARDDVGQRLAHLLGRLVALLARGRERAHDDGVELGRDPRGLRRRRLRVRVAHERHRRRGVEVLQLQVLVARQQLPHDDAQAVDVAARVGDLAARLLGREVGGAPEHDAGRRVLLLEHAAREAEVGELHLAEVRQQDVGRRDVAVHELEVAVAVHVGERARGLARDVQRDVERDARARAHAAVPDLAQVLALDELHGDVELAVVLARVEGGHEVRVREPQHDLRLVEEPVGLALVGALGDDLLDDAEFLEAWLARRGDIDLAHAATGERLEQDVLAEPARENFGHFALSSGAS